jgi:phospholipase C
LAPGETRTLTHPTSAAHGWYDLVVTVAGDPAFSRRLAGHIEDGRPSVTG